MALHGLPPAMAIGEDSEMKFVSFRRRADARDEYGVVVDDRVASLVTGAAPTLRAALAGEGLATLKARAARADADLDLSSLQLLPPITDPGKFICVGLNYHRHAAEVGMQVPSRPSLFVRFADSVTGHGQPTLRPPESEQYDYEAELAVVIGRTGRRIAESGAMAYVAGYCCLAENSVRDWQRHSAQATPGKNFFHSGALGPWLVTPDEAGPVDAMTIVGRLDGEEVQRESLSDLIFSVPQIIAYISTFGPLQAGDVIATGTPAGVGMSRKPPRWLRAGDVFEVEISGVGTLRNPVVDDRSETMQTASNAAREAAV